MDQLELDDDSPPFALSELSRPLHLFEKGAKTAHISASVAHSEFVGGGKVICVSSIGKACMGTSQTSSSPPGLAESVFTDGSSSAEYSGMQEQQCSYNAGASSNFLLSSLPTLSSVTGNSSYLRNSHHAFDHLEASQRHQDQVKRTEASGTFSQLMRAADGEDMHLPHLQMPSVPEDACMEDSSAPFGALISSPSSRTNNSKRTDSNNYWFPNLLLSPPRNGLQEPLLDTSVSDDEPVGVCLAAAPSEAALARARTGVRSFLGNDQSFEVSTEVSGPCSVQSVMNVIGNPELLRVWCDPIHNLVVTSTSDGSGGSMTPREDRREYEGEWIEATTTALESPPSSVGQIYSAGRAVLDVLGLASYGRITMFVERRRGHVGLTIGPFSGGMHASHHISVSESDGGVRIVDRVRLTRDTEEASIPSLFFCGVLDSCLLRSCFMPSLNAYMDQVSTSMARLQILVASDELSPEMENTGARQISTR